MTDKSDADKIDAYLKAEAQYEKDIWELAKSLFSPSPRLIGSQSPAKAPTDKVLAFFEKRYGSDQTSWPEPVKAAYAKYLESVQKS